MRDLMTITTRPLLPTSQGGRRRWFGYDEARRLPPCAAQCSQCGFGRREPRRRPLLTLAGDKRGGCIAARADRVEPLIACTSPGRSIDRRIRALAAWPRNENRWSRLR